MKFVNQAGDIVELLPETATNMQGKVLRWVRCANGHEASIWQDELDRDFTPVSEA